MLDFFKKLINGKDPYQNWHIPVGTSYKRIDNGDSIQFVSTDQSQVLYFSILKLSGPGPLKDTVLEKKAPALNRTENGWELKGFKQADNKMLICLFSFTKEDDAAGMEQLFNSISYLKP